MKYQWFEWKCPVFKTYLFSERPAGSTSAAAVAVSPARVRTTDDPRTGTGARRIILRNIGLRTTARRSRVPGNDFIFVASRPPAVLGPTLKTFLNFRSYATYAVVRRTETNFRYDCASLPSHQHTPPNHHHRIEPSGYRARPDGFPVYFRFWPV